MQNQRLNIDLIFLGNHMMTNNVKLKSQVIDLLTELQNHLNSMPTPQYMLNELKESITKVNNNLQNPKLQARILYQNFNTFALDNSLIFDNKTQQILKGLNGIANKNNTWDQIKNFGLTSNTWPSH